MERLNLKKFRKSKKLTQKQMAAKLGINQPYYSELERYKKKLNSEHYRRLYEEYGEEETSLYMEEYYEEEETDNKSFNDKIKGYSNVMQVPLVNQYAYEDLLNHLEDKDKFIKELPCIPFRIEAEQYTDDYICFEIKGDSMEGSSKDSIKPGDILLCREVKEEFWREELILDETRKYVLILPQRGILFRYISHMNKEEKTLHIVALNPLVKEEDIPIEEVKTIYIAMKLQRPQ